MTYCETHKRRDWIHNVAFWCCIFVDLDQEVGEIKHTKPIANFDSAQQDDE